MTHQIRTKIECLLVERFCVCVFCKMWNPNMHCNMKPEPGLTGTLVGSHLGLKCLLMPWQLITTMQISVKWNHNLPTHRHKSHKSRNLYSQKFKALSASKHLNVSVVPSQGNSVAFEDWIRVYCSSEVLYGAIQTRSCHFMAPFRTVDTDGITLSWYEDKPTRFGVNQN